MAGSATITGTQHYIMGIGHPKMSSDNEKAPSPVEYIVNGVNIGGQFVVSSSAPNNADGRPNGTIYIQTA